MQEKPLLMPVTYWKNVGYIKQTLLTHRKPVSSLILQRYDFFFNYATHIPQPDSNRRHITFLNAKIFITL